jgi:Endonuclease/Exonuclease/phosphatase family
MAVLMFWNLGRTDAGEAVATVCREHAPDIVILAEAPVCTAELLRHLNADDAAPFWEFRPVPSKITVFTRYPRGCIRQVFDDGRVSIRNLRPPIGAELLIVAVHLPSKLRADDGEQYYRVRQLRADVEAAEAQVGHRNTIIIGDLNANPFEDCLAAADGLHGVMDRQVALRQSRTVQGRAWSVFYNPMWSRMGDASVGPPGTYYYARGGLVTCF